eukprot:TRINITY_DN11479_c0_g1_i1.p1 TRINITY_DN11479_c0_g1~~TRINITY_DN11479_c0_g1_i1.p1  ORF type:complete len:133 (+),score=6.69 TRINITY_DN11479_c0_g1_i1:121-519(+)
MDPGANMWNSEIWVSPTKTAANLKFRTMASSDAFRQSRTSMMGDTTPKRKTETFRSSSVPTMPTLAMTNSPGVKWLGGPSTIRPNATLGFLQPIPRDLAPRTETSIGGHGHPHYNGTSGFSKFYIPTGNKWM